jgi:hypothetical protein
MKSKKCNLILFYHTLDLAVINSFILYKQALMKYPHVKPLNQRKFCIEISQVFGQIGENAPNRGESHQWYPGRTGTEEV